MLKTNRLTLRPFRREDLDFIYHLRCDPRIVESTIGGVQTIEVIAQYLENLISHQEKFGYSQLAVFENFSGRFIGSAGITNRTVNREIGEQSEISYALLPEFWNQGYASEFMAALLKLAFEDLDIKILAATTLETNAKSIKLLLKYGFKYIGKIVPDVFGIEDEVRYYLIARDEVRSPAIDSENHPN